MITISLQSERGVIRHDVPLSHEALEALDKRIGELAFRFVEEYIRGLEAAKEKKK